MVTEKTPRRDIIVVGTSAGGVQALQTLAHGLPHDFPAAVLIVMHISPTSNSMLPSILQQAGPLAAGNPRDGERIEHRRIYIAPPDHHMIVRAYGRVGLSRRGPRENGFRPAVDPLFRTAARVYGSRVIGIVLTGGLDDGTLGLAHIKQHGGVTIAQEPAEAVFPSMPQSAIRNVEVDHVLPVAAMPALLRQITSVPIPEGVLAMANPNDSRPDMAESGRASLVAKPDRGPPSNIICPECGGVLWELRDHRVVHYECHVGHSYTAESLLEGKSVELEGALWGAVRALEESAELRRRMAARMSRAPPPLGDMQRDYQRQADESEARAAVLRELLGNGHAAVDLAKLTGSEAEAIASEGNGPSARAAPTPFKEDQ